MTTTVSVAYKLLIDVREHKLFPILNSVGVPYEKESLDIGDVQIISYKEDNSARVPYMIIERKTISDLAASIKDGRYKEQKLRLKQLCIQYPHVHVAYIIEGNLSYNDNNVQNGLSGKAINTALYSMQFKDRISVISSSSILTTCNIIESLYQRYIEGKTDEWHLNNITHQEPNDVQFSQHQEVLIKQKKKENTSGSHTVFLSQLAAIPGISYNKATQIASDLNVSNIGQLYKKLSNSHDPVTEIRKVKGIGKTLATLIHEYICGKEN